jgi:hypothetical protein
MERYSRFDLDKVYEEIKENEAKLDQLEKEASLGYSYESVEVHERRNVTIQKWYWQNDILWKDCDEIYQYFYGNSPKMSSHNNMAMIIMVNPIIIKN